MAELGSYYITIMPSMQGFTSQVNSELGGLGTSGGNKFSGGFLDVIKGSAIGSALGGVASKLGNTFMSGISTGINRLDTLKNFPRVMQSFGYSADEASASVNKIMDHLRGLPTASQDVVSLTQAISDSTGDLNLASDAALGFNDMLLASGASSAEAATATGVLNRVLGKGSATTAQWQSLMAVMPKQLDMVAESMLGQGASAMDLYEALENGTFSYNDMLEAIAKLDSEGTAGMDSFYEQAKANSIGIGSSIENIQNRIGAGWANVFDAIGQMEIHDLLEGVADGLKAPLDLLAEAITHIKEVVADTSIGENLGIIAKGIGDFMTQIGQEASPILQDFADKLIYFIDNALQWVVDHGDLVSSLLVSIGTALVFKEAFGTVSTLMGVVTGLQALGEALPLVAGLADLPTAFTLAAEAGGPLSGMFSGLGGILAWFVANPAVLIVGAIAAIVAGLVWFFTQTETGQQMWQDFCDFLSEVWTGLKEDWDEMCTNLSENWAEFQAFIDGIPEWWEGVKAFWSGALEEQAENFRVAGDKIKSDFSDAWESIKNDTGEKWENIKTNASNAADTMKENLSTAWDNIKSNTGDTVTNIKDTVKDKFEATKSTALDIFESIKNGIREKVQWAKDRVSEIVEGIKSLFNFEWSLPAPKLPTINYHWLDIGGVLSIPVFDGIDWFAKGGIFTKPTIAGLGEAGTEAALPLNRQTYGEIARGIASEMSGTDGVVIEKIADTIIVQTEDDIDYIVSEVSRRTARERAAMA